MIHIEKYFLDEVEPARVFFWCEEQATFETDGNIEKDFVVAPKIGNATCVECLKKYNES